MVRYMKTQNTRIQLVIQKHETALLEKVKKGKAPVRIFHEES